MEELKIKSTWKKDKSKIKKILQNACYGIKVISITKIEETNKIEIVLKEKNRYDFYDPIYRLRRKFPKYKF